MENNRMKTLAEFKNEIRMAKTKEELKSISYEAFLQDDRALKSSKSLYEKVLDNCIKREMELRLL